MNLCQYCKGSHGQDVICGLDPINYDYLEPISQVDHEQAMAEKDDEIGVLNAHVEMFRELKIDPFRSNGFLNTDYDMARVYMDMPIIDAKKLLNELPQISLDNIKADAIEEMVRKLERDHDSQAEFNLWYDVRYYANKLRSNK